LYRAFPFSKSSLLHVMGIKCGATTFSIKTSSITSLSITIKQHDTLHNNKTLSIMELDTAKPSVVFKRVIYLECRL
jgi:hypothetical protein